MAERPRVRRILGRWLWQCGSYGIGLLLYTFALLGYNAEAIAQYIGQPAVINGPIPTAPVLAPAGGAPTGPTPPWLFTPSITIAETYTDNFNLDPPGQARTDLITTISPSLSVVGHTARVNLAFTYNPQLLLFALGTSSPQ